MRYKNGKPVIRCSSLPQLIDCPASRTIAAKLGEIETDDSSSWEGQWCHYQAALRFIEKNGALPPNDPRTVDGRVVDIGLPLPRIPKEWKPDSFAEWIVDYYHRAVMEETPGDWALAVEHEFLVEFPRFWLIGHIDEFAIAADATAANFDDLKSGSNIVDAAECNWQVVGYAALLKLTYDSLRRLRGRIIQPRVREGEGKRISAVIIDEKGIWNDEGQRISDATIDTFVPLLVEKIEHALDNPMLLNTGIKQCRWCVAAETLNCPAYEKEMELMKMELTPEALAAVKANPTPDTLAKWGAAKKLLEPRFKKAWELLKEYADKHGAFTSTDGIQVALKDWKGERSFTDKAAVWEQLAEALSPERAYACMDLSVPSVERAFAEELNLPLESKVKDSGEKQVANRFSGMITQKTGKQLTLVA